MRLTFCFQSQLHLLKGTGVAVVVDDDAGSVAVVHVVYLDLEVAASSPDEGDPRLPGQLPRAARAEQR